jgi:hypothetical protein
VLQVRHQSRKHPEEVRRAAYCCFTTYASIRKKYAALSSSKAAVKQKYAALSSSKAAVKQQ